MVHLICTIAVENWKVYSQSEFLKARPGCSSDLKIDTYCIFSPVEPFDVAFRVITRIQKITTRILGRRLANSRQPWYKLTTLHLRPLKWSEVTPILIYTCWYKPIYSDIKDVAICTVPLGAVHVNIYSYWQIGINNYRRAPLSFMLSTDGERFVSANDLKTEHPDCTVCYGSVIVHSVYFANFAGQTIFAIICFHYVQN